jgi:hypothetical protein
MDAQGSLDALKLKIATSAIVRQVDVVQERVSGDDGFFRARLALTNNDFLEVSEFFTVEQGQGHTVEYRHQWMDQTRQVMRQRWDNAKHSPGLPHFPHHIHGGEETRIEPGRSIGVVELIEVLEREMATTL